MNGLNVNIKNTVTTLYSPNSFLPASPTAASGLTVNTPFAVRVYTVGSPADLIDMYSVLAPTTDSKVYLRQSKRDLYIRNQGAPGWLKATWFYCRKNVDKVSFPDLTSLLSEQSIQNDGWATPLTLGNTAQRYLKFGKTKLIKMNQGGVHHIKLNLKYSSKQVSGELEVNNPAYLMTNITRGVILKWIPPARNAYNTYNTSVPASAILATIPAPYEIDILSQEYCSMYALGDADPGVFFTPLPPQDPGYLGGVMLPGFNHWAPATV